MDIIQKLKDIKDSAVRTAENIAYLVANGIDTTRVSEQESDNRMAICKQCEHLEGNGALCKCKICGCFMNVKTKLLFDPVESVKNKEKLLTVCPKGKW